MTNVDLSHVADNQDGGGYPVQCCSIDDWAAKNQIERIDFIKIDTEGHDIQVIEGARQVVAFRNPIIEFEAFDMDTVYRVYGVLRTVNPSAGYKVYRCCSHIHYPLYEGDIDEQLVCCSRYKGWRYT